MNRNIFRVAAAALFSMIPGTAWAHPDHRGQVLVDGLVHPLTGIDHLAAMVLVGMVAALLVKRNAWLVPVIFTVGLVGGFAASARLAAGAIEPLVLLSLVCGGLALLLRIPLAFALAIFATAIFGFAHGAAHGIDMPGAAVPALFAAGFLTVSVCLQGAGIWMARLMPVAASRAIGAAGAGMGVVLAFAA
jgi:urease accessory protein